jgi:hypothetical protein
VARDPALRPYRVTVIAVFLTLVSLFCFQLIKSVAYDLFGRPVPRAPQRAGAMACMDDLQRLFRGLQAHMGDIPDSAGATREFQAWSLRWEEELARVNARCHLDDPGDDPVGAELATAYGHLYELRRHAARCSDAGSAEASEVREALTRARKLVRKK